MGDEIVSGETLGETATVGKKTVGGLVQRREKGAGVPLQRAQAGALQGSLWGTRPRDSRGERTQISRREDLNLLSL